MLDDITGDCWTLAEVCTLCELFVFFFSFQSFKKKKKMVVK